MTDDSTPTAPLRLRLGAVALACCALLLTGAASCEGDGGPGVPEQGEQGDGSGNGGDRGEEGEPGEGGAGDEIGGGS
ncbi:hypothetical protein [Pseudonocardia hydrocarbonoxydans]|jgi:hypothetical protein|nr:hypothetical protein [Pseudonocardia hydrocarbonoxydans]